MKRGSLQLLLGLFLVFLTVAVARSEFRADVFFGVAASLSFLVGVVFIFFGAKNSDVFANHHHHGKKIVATQRIPFVAWCWIIFLVVALLSPVSEQTILVGALCLLILALIWLAFNEAVLVEESMVHMIVRDRSLRRKEIAWFAVVIVSGILIWAIIGAS